jgi:ClpP class serine protease
MSCVPDRQLQVKMFFGRNVLVFWALLHLSLSLAEASDNGESGGGVDLTTGISEAEEDADIFDFEAWEEENNHNDAVVHLNRYLKNGSSSSSELTNHKAVANQTSSSSFASRAAKKTKSLLLRANKHRFKILWAVTIAYLLRTHVRRSLVKDVIPKLTRLKPSTILTLILLADVLRRLHQGMDPGSLSMLALSHSNPVLMLVSKLLLNAKSTAFLPPVEQHYTFEDLRARYSKDGRALQKATGGQSTADSLIPTATTTAINNSKDVVLIMDLKLDSSLSQLDQLRDQVSFLLGDYGLRQLQFTANNTNCNNIEILVRLESPGGAAAEYALAAQQLMRFVQHKYLLTVSVDTVAASGGYMMACVASHGRLLAAPFAMVGSIGVVGTNINIHERLQEWGIQPLVVRGGKDKAPIGLIGKVTDEGIRAVQTMVDNTHRAFKRHVVSARPILSGRIEELATGDVWLGYDAIELDLVDRLITSDEYIGERMEEGAHVLKLVKMYKSKYPFAMPTTAARTGGRMSDSLRSWVGASLEGLLHKTLTRLNEFVTLDEHVVSACMKSSLAGCDLTYPPSRQASC